MRVHRRPEDGRAYERLLQLVQRYWQEHLLGEIEALRAMIA